MTNQWDAVLSRRWCIWIMAGIILAAGAYFRLVGLNDTSLHGDGIIHDVCKMNVSAMEVMVKWEQLIGRTSQMATPAAITKGFLNVFGLGPVRGNVILPSAIWGILAVIAAYWVGRRLGGRWFGLLLMTVVAFNPVHVQMSRMAYFYPPALVGTFLMLWCLFESWEKLVSGKRHGWRFHVVHVVAIVCLLYSTASTWPLTVLFALIHVGCSIFKWKRRQVSFGEVWLLAATYLVIGAPLLFFSWGLPALLSVTGQNETTAYWRRIFELGRSKSALTVVSEEFPKLAWGYTPMRSVVSSVIFGIGALVLGLRAKCDKRWLMPLAGIVAGIVVAIVAMRSSTLPFGLRRVAVVWPLGFIIMAAGLGWPWLVALPARGRMAICVGWGCVMAVLLGMWVQVDILAQQAKGFPIPYRQIGQWLDSHFSKGTPVVTERFYTAMCEFNQSDPTTNVVMLSTVMNELPEIQEKTRFREVTRQYFEDNPDAVFYCSFHMYERPEVVPWEWPTQYFKRSQMMKDEAADRLGKMGQSYHMDYPGVLRWPVIYYNTVEDVAAIKRGAGSSGFVLWGPDWRPAQTQDYRLWRLLMAGDADLKVYGLGATEEEVTLELMGVAAGGELRVQIGDQGLVFPANQIAQQRVKIKLQPGMNVVKIRSRGTQNARLLIGKAEVKKGI
jgi:hypothetical protein